MATEAAGTKSAHSHEELISRARSWACQRRICGAAAASCLADATRSARAEWTRACDGARSSRVGVSLGFEPALRVDRGRATAAGGSDGLAVHRILYVAAREHAFDTRVGAVRLGHDVAARVELELAFEQLGVG